MMAGVPDMRRRTPEPPAGPPQIQFKPGMANELLQELAPLLAEEGINVNDIDVPDLDTLQQALNRAAERHNMAMFTPVGHARELAAVTMRLAAEAISDGNSRLATAVLDQAQPESPDGSAATVASCIGVALGLLDQWLAGHDSGAPASLAPLTRLPAGHWTGERAASLPWPARAAPSPPSTRSSPGKAAGTSSTAAPSLSPPHSRPGPGTPERRSSTWPAPLSVNR
jgi:hypothetical protein